MVHSHTVHLPLGALLIWCAMCGAGENLLWLGIALASLGDLPRATDLALAFVSPAWSAFFLLFTSLMLLEKRMDARFSHDPRYLQHKRSTSLLVPWPPATLADEKKKKKA